jgi:hypothetical protein
MLNNEDKIGIFNKFCLQKSNILNFYNQYSIYVYSGKTVRNSPITDGKHNKLT